MKTNPAILHTVNVAASFAHTWRNYVGAVEDEEYSLAILDYRDVLRQVGERLPRQLAQKRIQVLRESHPEEYKQADEANAATAPAATDGAEPVLPLNPRFRQ